MTKDEALKLALEALEIVNKEMLTLRDELAERGGRPSQGYHQLLWDSSHKVYTDTAIPAAEAIREALAQPEHWAGVDFDIKTAPPQRKLKLAEHEHAIYCRGVEDGKAQRKPLQPQSPCEMTQAERKMFKLGWLECEAAHGIKENT